MQFVIDTLQADWEAFLRFLPRLLYGAVVMGVFLLLAGQLGRLTRRLLAARAGTPLLAAVVRYGVAAAGLLMALNVLGFPGIAASMLATGGVVAIVLGFAFREVGENLLAGFFLSFSRPFQPGDLVRSGDLTGTVRAIELRHVHLRAADACDVFVPSAQIFREPLYNYTRDGLRRPSFTLGVAYHDDPEEVIAVLESALGQLPDVLADPPPLVSIRHFDAQVVEYQVLFWLDQNVTTQGPAQVERQARIACWRALREAGMTFSTDVRSGVDITSLPRLQLEKM